MSCSGNKRTAWQRNEHVHSHNNEVSFEYKKIREDISFEYTGTIAISITGSVSGKKYRFLFNGDRQVIDYRDAAGMMREPYLRKISRWGDEPIFNSFLHNGDSCVYYFHLRHPFITPAIYFFNYSILRETLPWWVWKVWHKARTAPRVLPLF